MNDEVSPRSVASSFIGQFLKPLGNETEKMDRIKKR